MVGSGCPRALTPSRFVISDLYAASNMLFIEETGLDMLC
jgi:hypothetical protein